MDCNFPFLSFCLSFCPSFCHAHAPRTPLATVHLHPASLRSVCSIFERKRNALRTHSRTLALSHSRRTLNPTTIQRCIVPFAIWLPFLRKKAAEKKGGVQCGRTRTTAQSDSNCESGRRRLSHFHNLSPPPQPDRPVLLALDKSKASSSPLSLFVALWQSILFCSIRRIIFSFVVVLWLHVELH